MTSNPSASNRVQFQISFLKLLGAESISISGDLVVDVRLWWSETGCHRSGRGAACSLSTLPLHFFRAEAFELLPWSKRLEMLSSPPAIERGKATEWGGGPHLSTQVSNPSPSSHQYTLPPSMALRPVAVLWDKCALFSTYSFLCP